MSVRTAMHVGVRERGRQTDRRGRVVVFQDRPVENLNLAFDVAEKFLDIPRMLDAEGQYRTLARDTAKLISLKSHMTVFGFDVCWFMKIDT